MNKEKITNNPHDYKGRIMFKDGYFRLDLPIGFNVALGYSSPNKPMPGAVKYMDYFSVPKKYEQ